MYYRWEKYHHQLAKRDPNIIDDISYEGTAALKREEEHTFLKS